MQIGHSCFKNVGNRMQWDSLDFVSEKSGCRVVDFIDRWRHFVLLIWSI